MSKLLTDAKTRQKKTTKKHFRCLQTNYRRRACSRMFCLQLENKTQVASGFACRVFASDDLGAKYYLLLGFRADIFLSRAVEMLTVPRLQFWPASLFLSMANFIHRN